MEGSGHEAKPGPHACEGEHAEDEREVVCVSGVDCEGQEADAEGFNEGSEEEGEEGLVRGAVDQEVGEEGAETKAWHEVD